MTSISPLTSFWSSSGRSVDHGSSVQQHFGCSTLHASNQPDAAGAAATAAAKPAAAASASDPAVARSSVCTRGTLEHALCCSHQHCLLLLAAGMHTCDALRLPKAGYDDDSVRLQAVPLEVLEARMRLQQSAPQASPPRPAGLPGFPPPNQPAWGRVRVRCFPAADARWHVHVKI